MLKIDYRLNPGRELNRENFEIDLKQKPLISIVTPYYNSQKYIEETANSIFNQTFPYWEWIIVDDESTDEEAVTKLETIKKMDSRIKVFRKNNEGPAAARDYALKRTNPSTKYIMFLDSDDQIDKTYFECCYWTLETHPEASWACTDVINFDGQEFLWRKWYNPEWEKDENILMMCSFVRKSAIEEVGGFGLKEKKIYEDWYLWLKLIKAGKFPVRISSLLTWYRIKPLEESELRKSKSENDKRALKIVESVKRDIVYTKPGIQYPKQDYDWDTIIENYPNIVNVKKSKNKKTNILMIIPWMVTGGADKFNLDLISRMDKEKYEFTIISMLPSTNDWRQDFEKYATVYDLTSFLDRKDWISFINYIINKNNVDIIFNTNSQFGYNSLPYLKAKYPEIPIIDYVHMEEWYARKGGFSRDSARIKSVIDKTYTCNGNSKKIFEDYFNKNKDEVETVYIGVDEKKFDPELLDRNQILEEYKIVPNGKFIISYICRIAEQKRPYLFVEIVKELSKKRSDFLIVVAGEGPFLSEMKKRIKKYRLEDKFVFLGNVKETRKVYKISDLTVNCSIKEGLALTSYESLSMGVPVVSVDAGGQKELINSSVGVVVPCMQKETDIWNYNYKEEEILNYVVGIEKVLNNINDFKKNCRNRILNGFTIDNMVQKMEKEFDSLKQNPSNEKIENGYGLKRNIEITKELITQYLIESKSEYEWMANKFNADNIHIILKYDEKAKKEQFYEKTLEYKIKHPIVVLLRRIGIYDKIKQIIGWEKH
jgi:glycosyltransferase involved in cell wall biosynthesis